MKIKFFQSIFVVSARKTKLTKFSIPYKSSFTDQSDKKFFTLIEIESCFSTCINLKGFEFVKNASKVMETELTSREESELRTSCETPQTKHCKLPSRKKFKKHN